MKKYILIGLLLATTAVATNATRFSAVNVTGNLTAGSLTGPLTGNASNVTGIVAVVNGGTGASSKSTGFDALSPMSFLGDMIMGGAAGTGTRLAGNTSTTRKFLMSSGDTLVANFPIWDTMQSGDIPTLNQNTTGTASNVTGTVAIANGGTGQTSAQNAIDALLPTQTSNSGKFLTTNGATSSWGTPAGGGTVTSVTFTGDGTVLSSTPSSAVTSSGTVTATLNTQNAGTFLAGPTSGAAAFPTFRALQRPTIQKFLTGSGTYTTPAGVLYIHVKMVGGGGGGSAGGNGTQSATNNGTDGGNTTFGTCTAGGGGGGHFNASAGSIGTATIGSGFSGIGVNGGGGSVTVINGTGNAYWPGGNGASSALGGAGNAGPLGDATVNSGGGGAGGGVPNGTSNYTGTGGNAGAYLDVVSTGSVASTYSYSVGIGGSGGPTTGLSPAQTGYNGGSGQIVVEEYYQ